MKIIILSIGKGNCPKCNQLSDFFCDYRRDEDGVKLPHGYICGNCDSWFDEEEIEKILVDAKETGGAFS
jgi:hypothetical protein